MIFGKKSKKKRKLKNTNERALAILESMRR